MNTTLIFLFLPGKREACPYIEKKKGERRASAHEINHVWKGVAAKKRKRLTEKTTNTSAREEYAIIFTLGLGRSRPRLLLAFPKALGGKLWWSSPWKRGVGRNLSP